MNAKLLALVAFGAVCMFFGWYGLAHANPELDKLQKEVLSLSAQLNGNCSSTLVYSDRDKKTGEVTTLFLTAKHCVVEHPDMEQSVDIPIYQHGRIVQKHRYLGKVYGQAPAKIDLALVQLNDKETWFDTVGKIADAKEDVIMGEPVWTVGYPLAQALTITEGLFGSWVTVDYPTDGIEYIRATPDIAPGNSGGALWHKNADGDYELIGVTSAGYQGYPFASLYTPFDKIQEYLKIALPKPADETAHH